MFNRIQNALPASILYVALIAVTIIEIEKIDHDKIKRIFYSRYAPSEHLLVKSQDKH